MTILVNKEHLFDERYLDTIEMVEYENHNDEVLYIERETYEHFIQLQAHLRVDGVIIDIVDAYRSLEKQENIFLEFMKKYGLDYAEEMVAMPGTSEHHTGLAIDIVINKDGEWIEENKYLLNEQDIFSKIHRDLKYFGFIVRYPKGKQDITGYPYEPWHLRNIGKDAEKIGNLTLEEYLRETQ